jgi:butyrate kinase
VVDVNDGLGGDGPFSPERAGGVPAFALIDKCFAKGMDKKTIKKKLVGNGGLMSYLKTADVKQIEEKINHGDQMAKFYLQAMCYQIAKEIGSLYFVANGKIDQLIITGGIAHSKLVIKYLKTYINSLLPITIYPGENEMESLMQGAKRVLDKKEKIKTY